MLNPTSTCKNTGITGILRDVIDIAQRPKTACGNWFAGKMWAKIHGKSKVLTALVDSLKLTDTSMRRFEHFAQSNAQSS